MRVVVPFDAAEPKTRLAPVLDATERREFAQQMLEDVLDVVAGVDPDPAVVATAPVELDGAPGSVRVDDRPLSAVVDDALAETLGGEDAEALAVVMADLALLTREALDRLVGTDGDVVLAPGRGVGTNALVVRTPRFHVDFHGASYLDHRDIAREVGATLGTVDSYRLATDIDEPADLVEAAVHGEGRAADWLAARFTRAVDTEGRVTLDRR